MTIYRVTVEKFMAQVGEYWTNVYHWNDQSGGAGIPMNALVDAERPLYPNTVLITKVSQDVVEVDSNYASPLIVNLQGTAAIGNNDLMPLFVCGRVDLMYEASRPGRKYYRAALHEQDTTVSAIQGPTLTRLQTCLTALLAIPGLCDEDGDALIGGAVFQSPAMRQLRRGSRKKNTP